MNDRMWFYDQYGKDPVITKYIDMGLTFLDYQNGELEYEDCEEE